jgi:hypothetical protein
LALQSNNTRGGSDGTWSWIVALDDRNSVANHHSDRALHASLEHLLLHVLFGKPVTIIPGHALRQPAQARSNNKTRLDPMPALSRGHRLLFVRASLVGRCWEKIRMASNGFSI